MSGDGWVPARRGAVEDVYADTNALEFDCPECGQPKGSVCRWVDTNNVRKLPCGARQRLGEAG